MELEQFTLDFTGKKGKVVFEELRENIRSRCKESINIEVLVDDEECVRKVQAFSKMTGCKVAWTEREKGYLVHITGNSCKCV